MIKRSLAIILDHELIRALHLLLPKTPLEHVGEHLKFLPDRLAHRGFRLFLRVRFETSARITKLSQHEADGSEFQEGERVAVEIFPVLGEAAAAVEPRNRAFNDPTLR